MPSIPIIDLGELGLPAQPSEEEWQRVAREIKSAFQDIGFVYLSNHGIPQGEIDEVFGVAEDFFTLEDSTKRRYLRGVQTIQGYTAPNQERLTEVSNIQELRESFDIHTPDGTFPDQELASLRPATRTLFEKCSTLSSRLLTAMAIALGLERSYFVKRHKGLAGLKNSSSMRLLYYPALPADEGADEGVTRCGAHTDYGTVTLLFQDTRGGLEVKERGGSWVSALPIPGTILVNAGDILQFWTGDTFRATFEE
ncbi:UPF0676 protein C1494.01-like isoform X2 [Portunus trituberculatus]|uniref:UPF0676 protein C1494.01-like isoform X2 n=1 Tax=Portunus trituberculatus TaxID=210409 RepID=UPI001E1CF9B7|nr:UPF0676 protein C1494.01-like isoform X2 [Portunus trituberculatus]